VLHVTIRDRRITLGDATLTRRAASELRPVPRLGFIMQRDPGSSRLISGKRKVAEVPSVSESVRGKKSKTGKSHPETGKPSAARGDLKSNSKDDSKWPDYFKEVSV